jgi:xanthine dehydrogenase accessory factor
VHVREVLDDIRRWLAEGQPVALATVIRTWGSAPRAIGSKMVVSGRGEMSGSVSGGCVEAAVVEESQRILASGVPRRLHFGVSDESAWEVGLACGGQIDVFVEPLSGMTQGEPSVFGLVAEALAQERPVVRMLITDGPQEVLGASVALREDGVAAGALSGRGLMALRDTATEVLHAGKAEARTLQIEGREVEVFFDVLMPAPTLLIVGGAHIAITLARLAKGVGYRVVIVDPRSAFATEARFPDVDGIIRQWPDEGLARAGLNVSTAVVTLSHDPKLDDPALLVALPSPAFYVGALGSRRTDQLRRQRLRDAGLDETHLHRLHAPAGLDLGGRDPEEIALSILAEIVAARSGSALARRG